MSEKGKQFKAKQNINSIDIGELIKKEVDRQKLSYSEFARMICCSRSTVYSIFNSRDISVLRLLRICSVLKCDILKEIQALDTSATLTIGDTSFIAIPFENGTLLSDGLPSQVIDLLKAVVQK